jgi:hypothetical protein
MRFMLSFQCEDMAEAQSVLSAVAAIGIKPIASRVIDEPDKLFKDEPTKPVPMQRANVSPGTSTLSRTGAIAVAEILRALNADQQPPAKYTEHCKLLWSRGELKFDGTLYYLP